MNLVAANAAPARDAWAMNFLRDDGSPNGNDDRFIDLSWGIVG